MSNKEPIIFLRSYYVSLWLCSIEIPVNKFLLRLFYQLCWKGVLVIASEAEWVFV